MITIKYSELGKISTQKVIQKLTNSTFKTPKAFTISHITKTIRQGFFDMREEYVKDIESKYLNKDATDTTPTGDLPFSCKAGMESDCKGALDAFGNKTLTINRKKIDGALLFECNDWTPQELEALEFLVEEPAQPSYNLTKLEPPGSSLGGSVYHL